MTREHVHNFALGALVGLSGETKAEIGRRAQLTPAGIGDLISGRRAGLSDDIRGRIAEALDVDIRAITCWCDDRSRHVPEGVQL